MKKEEIVQLFHDVQNRLESLHGERASFLFVGHEGNHFTIGGNVTEIQAQIVFAMCRYPIIRDTIMGCVRHFDELNEKYGEKAREARMDHLIETYSGIAYGPDNAKERSEGLC